jgi:hypothetical protein
MVELFINGTGSTVGQVTLYGDEPLSLNISVQDVKDISKRNSTFSQTFTIPADKNNNILLNHIFNIGSDSSFDPSKKTPSFILNDGMPVFNGQFQLTKINVKNRNVISYECVVYGEMIDLVKSLGDKLLTDLDCSDINHNRTIQTIEDSWTADTKTLGYYYPLIDYGYDLDYNEVNTGFLSISIDYGVCSSALSSSFTDLGKNWVVNQFAGNQLSISSGLGVGQIRDIVSNTPTTLVLSSPFTTIPDFTSEYNITKYDTTNILNSGGDGMRANLFKPAISNHYLFNKIVSTNGFTWNSDFLNSDIFTNTIMPYSGGDDEQLFQKFSVRLSYTYSVPTLLLGDTNVDVWYVRFHRSSLTTGISTNGGPATCFYQLVSRKPRVIGNPIVGMPLVAQQDYVLESCMLDNGVNSPIVPPNSTVTTSNAWRYPLKDNEEVWVEFLITNVPGKATYIFDTNTSFFNTLMKISGAQVGYNINTFRASISSVLPYSNVIATNWLDMPFDDDSTGDNFDYLGTYDTTTHKYTNTDFIEMGPRLPKNIKQVDYVKSIITMFNLMTIPNKNNPNSLTFIPRNDYYATGQIKDWTSKIDHTEKIEETLISEQQSKSIRLSYKEDKDYYNANYKEETNTVYGQYIKYIDNEWVTGEKKIEVIFSPTPVDRVLGSTDIYLPKIAKRDEKSGIYGRTDFNPRFLVKRPEPLQTIGTIKLDGRPARNSYPYCGHLDHPINPTIDYNFGAVNFVYYEGLSTMTPHNLVYDYWEQYLNDINDKNSKLIKCKIYLTPDDIAQFNYNDSIYIEGLTGDGGHYFNVNKINYIPTSNLPSTIELIKNTNIPQEVNEGRIITNASLNPIKYIDLGNQNFSRSAGAIILGDGNNVDTSSKNTFIAGNGNNVGSSSKSYIVGNNVTIGSGVIDAYVYGSNVIVENPIVTTTVGTGTTATTVILSGVTVFGSNITATTSNTVYVPNVQFTSTASTINGQPVTTIVNSSNLWTAGGGGASVVQVGGANIASGDYSLATNIGTQAIGDYSHAEGDSTEANGQSSHAGGVASKADRFGEWARSGDGLKGQYGIIDLMATTFDNTTVTDLWTAEGFGFGIIPLPGEAYRYRVICLVQNPTTGAVKEWEGKGLHKNVSGVVSSVGSSLTSTYGDASLSTAVLTIDPGFDIYVTGVDSTTLNWYLTFEYTRIN